MRFRTQRYWNFCCRIILSGREVCPARFAVAKVMLGAVASNINTVSRIEEEGAKEE